MSPDERKRGLRAAVEANLKARHTSKLAAFKALDADAHEVDWFIKTWTRDLLWNCIDSLVDEAAESEAILREFMADIEAVGVKITGKDWPDLVITYNKARLLFKRTEEDHA